jgi:hypothetical protein
MFGICCNTQCYDCNQALLTPYLEASDEDAQHDAYAHEQRKELLVSAQTAAAVMFECFA